MFEVRRIKLVCSILLSVFMLTFLSSCETAYYSAMEKVGYHKREIMVDRIEDVAESQEEAQKQFKDALEEFSAVAGFNGGDLEAVYSKLNAEYEESVEAAEEIRSRIDDVESVSEALFKEWEDEIKLYTNAQLRKESQAGLMKTQRDYKKLMAAMRKSESSLTPVLNTFRDQVLYLKHNLNARAIASLKGELKSIDSDVQQLIREMDKSIAEARRFIADLK